MSGFVRAANDGELRWFSGGGIHRWMATTEQTDGSYLMFEDRMERGKVTPLHLHPDADESMYLLEGEILIHLDGVEHRVGAGGLAMVPRGTQHAFLVTSEMARMLVLITPGVGQEFFFDASEPYVEGAPHEVDFAKIQQSARTNGSTVILGPPPFANVPVG